MTKEAGRTSYIDPDGNPITVIEFNRNNGGDERGDEVKLFRVRRGNHELKTFDNAKDAQSFAEALGGRNITNNAEVAAAAELGGTAAHQAAHAEDVTRLAALVKAEIDRQDKASEARTAGGRRPSAAQRKARDQAQAATEALEAVPDDSQASGVMPMHLGLRPDAAPALAERIPGAAEEVTGVDAELPKK